MKMEEKLHLMMFEGVEAFLNLVISLLDSKEINKKTVRRLFVSLRQGIREARQELQPNSTTTKTPEDLESVDQLLRRVSRLEDMFIGDGK